MVRILFVCHGNICRSPMAEFVMKKLVSKIPVGKKYAPADFVIASAATSTEEIGNPVYPPARKILARNGIDCRGKCAVQMKAEDYAHYDYIVLMDLNNLRNLRWILPADIYARETDPQVKGKISLLMDWCGENRDVADPWYTGDFEETWKDVNKGCHAMLEKILQNLE
ncbi:low molecular weight protein-tyrosine-phosphatase [uncultured Fibrobacter sp.]|uniref:low molecular weight protein-tyrosine-phosphatase n=1 Tax=uncultured Fibrobacter sp. TaxID=261512 RepID=UPI002805BCDB|nr:low molecular weight protein-tyrosine-phosphatase [uncultured Fibrobacter sp.]